MKIGIIDYINSIPFSYGMEQYGEIVRDTPRNLAQRFFDGELDFSFIPAIEYLKMREYCSLLESVTISSFGTTDSVTLFYNAPIETIESVKLSNESRTSNFLIREILEKRYHIKADYSETEYSDAEIIIGDKALNHIHHRYTNKLDVGDEWFKMTGLPVVYAVCVARSAELAARFAETVNKLTTDNLANIASILTALHADKHYNYIKNLNYSFAAPHRAALECMSRLYQARQTTARSLELVSN